MLVNHKDPSPNPGLAAGAALPAGAEPAAVAPLPFDEGAAAFVRRMDLLAGGLRGRFRVLSDQRDGESALVVVNPEPHAPNRYISGFDAQGRKYLAAAPEELVRAHKELLEQVQACLGRDLSRIGAGMVYFRPDGRVYVCGLSPTFQHRDHDYAHARLTELLAAGAAEQEFPRGRGAAV